MLETSLNTAVARAIDARDPAELVAERAAVVGVFALRTTAERELVAEFAERATVEPPRNALDTITPRVATRDGFDALREASIRPPERWTVSESVDGVVRTFDPFEAPRGFGDWTAPTETAPHISVTAVIIPTKFRILCI